MKKKLLFLSLLGSSAALLGGCAGVQNKEGTFYDFFVRPFESLLHFFGSTFDGNYGLAIIAITLIVRLCLMPIMLNQYKKSQGMKEKMDKLKPELDSVQKRMKELTAKEKSTRSENEKAKIKQEQLALQQEMMGLYSKHGVNPLNMGCLPMLIQMPIIMGLYYSILYAPDEVKNHHFLWFSLGHPDLIMMVIAGAVYFVQAQVSLWTIPEQQKSQMKMMVWISPLMIMFISYKSMAALPLYWTVGGLLLIFQTYLGRKFYAQHPDKALESVEK